MTTTTTTTTTTKKPSEHIEQRLFIKWMRQTHRGVRILSIPNGGKRGKAEAGRLKAEGLSPGVPDLYIPALKLWIEMKVKGGKVEPEQKDWHEYLRGIGDTVEVCWSKDEAVSVVLKQLATRGEPTL